jgi:alkane 1-monooxygenase
MDRSYDIGPVKIFGMFKYARFAVANILQFSGAVLLLFGGSWMWLTIGLYPVYCLIDEFLGTDETEPVYAHPAMLNVFLLMTMPLTGLLYVIYLYYASAMDPLGLEGLVGMTLDFDLGARQTQTTWLDLIGGGLGIAMFLGSAGINAAHELLHRTNSRLDQIVARWLLAFSLDTTWLVYHLHGHHRLVATDLDVISARRGEHIAPFIARASIGTNMFAFGFEADRLRKRGRSPWAWSNRALRGQLMSLALAALAYALGGWIGVVAFVLIGLNAKAYLEAISYIEHFGLVRVPGTPIAARHTWDCYHALSSALLFNLTRHSDHHQNGHQPYWENKVQDEAPRMPYGYGTMILCAFVPPLWRRTTGPILDRWDRELASAGELELVRAKGWLKSEPGSPLTKS